MCIIIPLSITQLWIKRIELYLRKRNVTRKKKYLKKKDQSTFKLHSYLLCQHSFLLPTFDVLSYRCIFGHIPVYRLFSLNIEFSYHPYHHRFITSSIFISSDERSQDFLFDQLSLESHWRGRCVRFYLQPFPPSRAAIQSFSGRLFGQRGGKQCNNILEWSSSLVDLHQRHCVSLKVD